MRRGPHPAKTPRRSWQALSESGERVPSSAPAGRSTYQVLSSFGSPASARPEQALRACRCHGSPRFLAPGQIAGRNRGVPLLIGCGTRGRRWHWCWCWHWCECGERLDSRDRQRVLLWRRQAPLNPARGDRADVRRKDGRIILLRSGLQGCAGSCLHHSGEEQQGNKKDPRQLRASRASRFPGVHVIDSFPIQLCGFSIERWVRTDLIDDPVEKMSIDLTGDGNSRGFPVRFGTHARQFEFPDPAPSFTGMIKGSRLRDEARIDGCLRNKRKDSTGDGDLDPRNISFGAWDVLEI